MQLNEIHKKIVDGGLLLDAAKVQLKAVNPESNYDQALKNFLMQKVNLLLCDLMDLSLIMNEHNIFEGNSERICKVYDIEVKQ